MRGVRVRDGDPRGHTVNGNVLEHIRLGGQSAVGLENQWQSLSIRGLRTEGTAPALKTYGTVSLLEATVNYNGGRVFLRDVATRGSAVPFWGGPTGLRA
jgi:hypothetical protein